MSHQDQTARPFDEFLAGIPLAPDVSRDWFKAVTGAQEYTVTGVTQKGKSAVVTVKVTRPDLPLWERTIDATTDPVSGPTSEASKSLSMKSFPLITHDDNIVAVKEGGDWKIFCDFPAKESIEGKHREGIEAYHKHDYDRAIAAYQAAIDSADLREQATGSAGIKFNLQNELDNLKIVKARISEGNAYIPKLALSDVEMKMAASKAPGIFGKITNKGDKAIDEVVVTATYFESSGKEKKEVFSEQHSIVVTPIEFVNFSRPVLPFVPGETRSFGFKLIAPREIQNRASVDLEVSGIVLTQSTAPLPKPPPG